MGLFDAFKNKNTNETAAPVSTTTGADTSAAPAVGLLNLEKGQLLDLTKVTSSLEKLRVAAGWDVSESGRAYDLDVAAYLCDKNGVVVDTVYYGDKRKKGISLDGDNLTGEGDGDDETITVNLEKINPDVEKIVFAVVIYSASSRNQQFKNVHNAYTRVLDDSQGGKELCRFELTENGGDNTAVITAELNRNSQSGGQWTFKAIGDYSRNSIESLKRQIH